MDRADVREEQKPESAVPESSKPESAAVTSGATTAEASAKSEVQSKDKAPAKKKKNAKRHSKRKSKRSESDSETGANGTDKSVTASDTSESESESDEETKARSQKKSSKKMRAGRTKKGKSRGKKTSAAESSSEANGDDASTASDTSDSESESESSSSEEEEPKRRKNKRRSKKWRSRATRDKSSESEGEDVSDEEDEEEVTETFDANAVPSETLIQMMANALSVPHVISKRAAASAAASKSISTHTKSSRRSKKRRDKKVKKHKRGSVADWKRVNYVWDNNNHMWKLSEGVDEDVDEYDEYAFLVKKHHDWDNHPTKTTVDVKSKLLKEALMEVMKDVQGETLEAEQPSIEPNVLFNYSEELRTYYKKTLKAKLKKEKKRKAKKMLETQIKHVRLLVKYLDEDYEQTKKTLYPLLEAGNITFDLLWALFKPNTLAYTSTYGDHDNPRCFKVDRATKESSFIKGEWYSIEGRYLEYDGKNFGLGEFESTVEAFKGSRKITSLATYPLEYHKDPEKVRKQLVERGQQFVTLTGQNYRQFQGIAYQKKRKSVAKFNITKGRIIVDSALFRRINANYPISLIQLRESDDDEDDEDDEDGCGCNGCSDEDEDGLVQTTGKNSRKDSNDESEPKGKYKVIKDKKGKYHVVYVPTDEDGQDIRPQNIEHLASTADEKHTFTEEELLIASPVVLGFAFQEKTWLEFTVSGITPIEWNTEAYSSLVLPSNQKHVVKALVSAHKFHGSKTIDDVVQGKGKGLVFVLHGNPGVGKTLTAEGVAEDLKVPLYMVSMGELPMDSTRLEGTLQQIMDIAHSWGAVLLLDEADVFLEKRQTQDVARNALVSCMLRLLEYFQGILFLTTNRVETFDEAFQSRIHVALKYEELSYHARRQVWGDFIERVRVKEGLEVMSFGEEDYDWLARKRVNGRQIKNAVRTAQALALYEKKGLSIEHIKRVLEVHESFDKELKGGTGYDDAMRSYT